MIEPIDNLIIKYLSKDITLEEEECLLEWLELSEKNKQYFRSLKDIIDLERLDADRNESQVESQWNKLLRILQPSSLRPNKSKYFINNLLSYAAVFILALLSYHLIHLLRSEKEDNLIVETRIETGIGDRSKIFLPDGSVVWINACSSISYDNKFGADTRKVYLKGEAFFDIKTDSLKPFLVHTDIFTYRVTGTSFNVYSFDDENEKSIALIEGSVTIEYNNNKEKLYPGEIFIYDKTTETISRKRINTDSFSSWRYGGLVFDEMTFEDLTRRLERAFNVKFVFENKKIKTELFNGSFRNYESLDTILKVISTSTPMQYRIDKNIVYIK